MNCPRALNCCRRCTSKALDCNFETIALKHVMKSIYGRSIETGLKRTLEMRRRRRGSLGCYNRLPCDSDTSRRQGQG